MGKLVSQLDPSGYFVDGVIADSDQRNPGNWLLPFGCVDLTPPPEIPVGQRERVVAGAWVFEDIPPPQPAPEPVLPTHAELVSATIVKAKQMRLSVAGLLTELQIDAMTDSDTETATTIKQLKDGLTAIVNMDLSAYQTGEQMEAAVLQAYYTLAASAPPEIQSAFNALAV